MNLTVFRLSENSGSYYFPVYLYEIKGTISANEDSTLIWKKHDILEQSLQPWENIHGHLVILLLQPDFQLLCCLPPIDQGK